MLFRHPKFANDLFRRFTPNSVLFVIVNRPKLTHEFYFFAIHHCTFSFITAHFRSSLHVKTSPGAHDMPKRLVQIVHLCCTMQHRIPSVRAALVSLGSNRVCQSVGQEDVFLGVRRRQSV